MSITHYPIFSSRIVFSKTDNPGEYAGSFENHIVLITLNADYPENTRYSVHFKGVRQWRIGLDQLPESWELD